jgi:hypothetical protein
MKMGVANLKKADTIKSSNENKWKGSLPQMRYGTTPISCAVKSSTSTFDHYPLLVSGNIVKPSDLSPF